MRLGYRRVSSEDQSFARQDLSDCEKIFEEKASALGERQALDALIAFSRAGDEVYVHAIDRLARSLRDLQDILQCFSDKGVGVRFLSEGLVFPPQAEDPLTKLQLQMMGAFAEFERSLLRQRQAEGIAKAKARGVYKGRPAKIEVSRIYALKREGLGAAQIARQMGISRATVYRALRANMGP